VTALPPELESWSAPRWERGASELLRMAEERIRPVAACTPENLAAELARLEASRSAAPRFVYATRSTGALYDTLLASADALDREGPLGALYAERARELALEAAICDAIGTPALRELAARRYPSDEAADELADAWLEEEADISSIANESLSDDAADPISLISRLRQEVGRRRLPIQVRPAPELAALAATGRGVIYVACGRRLDREDVARTVLHELDGHAMPRFRAARAPLGLFDVGTRGGSDTQEGYALALEESHGFLGARRRRELALRHVAAAGVRAGADFADTFEALSIHGAPRRQALRLAARVHRGGGLAREIAYLPSYLRVRAALSQPHVRAVLEQGRVALDAVDLLAPFIPAIMMKA
jgi:hypothetical protein